MKTTSAVSNLPGAANFWLIHFISRQAVFLPKLVHYIKHAGDDLCPVRNRGEHEVDLVDIKHPEILDGPHGRKERAL